MTSWEQDGEVKQERASLDINWLMDSVGYAYPHGALRKI